MGLHAWGCMQCMVCSAHLLHCFSRNNEEDEAEVPAQQQPQPRFSTSNLQGLVDGLASIKSSLDAQTAAIVGQTNAITMIGRLMQGNVTASHAYT
jgi:hypothetical protein